MSGASPGLPAFAEYRAGLAGGGFTSIQITPPTPSPTGSEPGQSRLARAGPSGQGHNEPVGNRWRWLAVLIVVVGVAWPVSAVLIGRRLWRGPPPPPP